VTATRTGFLLMRKLQKVGDEKKTGESLPAKSVG